MLHREQIYSILCSQHQFSSPNPSSHRHKLNSPKTLVRSLSGIPSSMFPGLLKQTLSAVPPQPRDCPQTKPITSAGGSHHKDVGAAMLGPCQGGLGMAFSEPVLSVEPKPSSRKKECLCRLVSPLLDEVEQLIRNALPSSLLEGFYYHSQPG